MSGPPAINASLGRGNTKRLARARLIYIALFAIVVIVGFAMGGRGQTFAAAAAAFLGVGGIWYGDSVLKPTRAAAWATLAVGVGLAGAGEICLGFSGNIGGQFPSLADVLYAVAYLPLAVALLWIGHPRTGLNVGTVLDAAVLSLIGSLVAWLALFKPALADMNLSAGARAVAMLDWVGDIALLAVAVIMLFTWRKNRAVQLLTLAIIALLVADVRNGIQLVHGNGSRGTSVDLAFIAFCLLCGLAAMDPSTRWVTNVAPAPEWLNGVRLALIALALLVPSAALLAESSPGPVTDAQVIAAVSGLVALLLLARVTSTLLALRDNKGRERALRDAASSLSLAEDPEEVRRDLQESVATMIGRGTPRVSLARMDPQLTHSTIAYLGRGQRARLRVPVSPSHSPSAGVIGQVCFEGSTRSIIGHKEPLEALADQAGTALARVSLVGAVRDHERESYFRTLVLNSSDVILICRDDTIEYATPSAGDLFDRPTVIGKRFHELVHLDLSPEERAVTSGDSVEEGVDGEISTPDGARQVRVHWRDLTNDSTVRGFVVTLRDVTAQKRLENELTHRATHDSLTGLANGALLREQLRDRERQASADRSSALLFVDLDNFKEVNDRLGHAAGDDLLKATADRLTLCLRRDHDIAARLGGDEFAILLRNLRSPAPARDVATRVVNAFRQPIYVHDVGVICTVSIGIATATTTVDYDSLLRRADIAVYAAKAAGRNTWREYEHDLAAPSVGRAYKQPALTLHYQPIVDMSTGEALGFEALTRLDRGNSGLKSPADFIAEAEKDGLIVPIGEWVFEQALRDAPQLNGDGSRYVSINVSPVQLAHRGFARSVLDRLASSSVVADRLMVELTEQLQLEHGVPAWDELSELHDAGVRVALDDYGTGYSSLSYLRNSFIDAIKLDRSFLRDVQRARSTTLLDVAVHTARVLDIDLIVEGVENAAARNVALAAGATHGQGLFFAPALPLEVAAEWADRPAPVSRGSPAS